MQMIVRRKAGTKLSGLSLIHSFLLRDDKIEFSLLDWIIQ